MLDKIFDFFYDCMVNLFRKGFGAFQSKDDNTTTFEFLQFLLKRLHSSESEVRWESLKTMHLIIELPGRKGAYSVSWSTITDSLQQQLLRSFISALHDKDKRIQQEAEDLIQKLSALRIDPALLKTLEDEEWMGVLSAVLYERDKKIREKAAGVLEHIADVRSIPVLIQLLYEPHWAVQRVAAAVLKTMHWTPKHEEERIQYLLVTEDWEHLAAIGSPAIEPLEKYWNEERPGVRAALKNICALVTTVVFGTIRGVSFNYQTTWCNPEVADFPIVLKHLRKIFIDPETYHFHQAERFLTYAVNAIGQNNLKEQVEVYIIGDPEKLHANLRNSLINLCRDVQSYSKDEL